MTRPQSNSFDGSSSAYHTLGTDGTSTEIGSGTAHTDFSGGGGSSHPVGALAFDGLGNGGSSNGSWFQNGQEDATYTSEVDGTLNADGAWTTTGTSLLSGTGGGSDASSGGATYSGVGGSGNSSESFEYGYSDTFSDLVTLHADGSTEHSDDWVLHGGGGAGSSTATGSSSGPGWTSSHASSASAKLRFWSQPEPVLGFPIWCTKLQGSLNSSSPATPSSK